MDAKDIHDKWSTIVLCDVRPYLLSPSDSSVHLYRTLAVEAVPQRFSQHTPPQSLPCHRSHLLLPERVFQELWNLQQSYLYEHDLQRAGL